MNNISQFILLVIDLKTMQSASNAHSRAAYPFNAHPVGFTSINNISKTQLHSFMSLPSMV
jgi:hypothetical protein